MAFRRKKVYRRKRTYKRKTQGVAKVAAAVRTLARQVRPELKYYDYPLNVSPSRIGVIHNLLDAISLGTNQGHRVGNKINPLSIYGHGAVRFNQNTSSETQMLRVILFRAHNDNGQTFQVYSDPTSPVGVLTDQPIDSSINMKAPYHWNNRKRFRIIYDKTFTLQSGGTAIRQLNWRFKLKGATTYAESDSNELNNNGLYILFVSDHNTDSPNFQWNARLCYTDA